MTLCTELPDELIREILTRLPIQSVILFRCVSKSWLFLLTHPGFIKDQIIQNHLHKYDYLVAQKDKKIFVLSHYKETSGLPFAGYELIGSVRGLVCLRQGKKLVLWNPAIQQYAEFMYPHGAGRSLLTHVGLGFDPVNNDYKMVLRYESNFVNRVSVYSSSSASWSDSFLPHNLFVDRRTFRICSVAPKVIVKDCPYWTYTTPGSAEYKHVLLEKFDAGSNQFKLLPSYCIYCSDFPGRRKKFEFVNMDDSPTILEWEVGATAIHFRAHSLKEERDWVFSSHFTVESVDFHLVRTVRGIHGLDHRLETDFLKEIRPTQGFEYDRNIVLHRHGIFLCYGPETNIIKAISGTSSAVSSICCFRYKPSFAFLRGMKPVDSQNQASTSGG